MALPPLWSADSEEDRITGKSAAAWLSQTLRTHIILWQKKKNCGRIYIFSFQPKCDPIVLPASCSVIGAWSTLTSSSCLRVHGSFCKMIPIGLLPYKRPREQGKSWASSLLVTLFRFHGISRLPRISGAAFAITISLRELSDFRWLIWLAMLSLSRLIFLIRQMVKVKMFLELFFYKGISVWL